jgi:uncharacterized protein YraI
MRRRSIIAFCTLFLATVVPAVASAAPGFSTADVNMRAGPSTANPVVTTIPAGSPVEIIGCLNGWSWCDTPWAGYRGWVAGSYLNASWQGRAVPVVAYAPRLGVPVVVYNGPAYWRRYYAGKPWFVGRPIRPIHGCVRGRRGRIVCR